MPIMTYNALVQEELDAHSDYTLPSPSPPPSPSLSPSESEHHHLNQYRTSPALDFRARSRRSDAMDAPRTVSREGSVLRHPTPDLQSLQGAYVGNVERLEQSAERLSLSSDLGEELRKMKMEQRRSESRQSSTMNTPSEEEEHSPALHPQSSYGYGSHASNSIVDTNNVARSGGFSPAAYFASPRNSVRSGSWSHQSSIKRSASYGTRLTQVSEPEQEGKPLDSPISTRFVPTIPQPEPLANALRVMNDGQFNLNDVEIPRTDPEEPEMANQDHDPRASTDRSRQVNGIFADFDGVHAGVGLQSQQDILETPDNVNRRISSYPPPTSRAISYMEPNPAENMVYYPAPVPMMLNLPKKLSRLPAAAHRDKQRSEMLYNLPGESRQSAPWLPDMPEGVAEGSHHEEDIQAVSAREIKRRTMADLPPQLRATMFFDQPSVPPEVELKGESAVATLDSILDASAFAPVSAFTDHPFAGHVGAEVYGKTPVGSKVGATPPDANASRKRRSSLNILKRVTSSSNLLDQSQNRSSPNLLTKHDTDPDPTEIAIKRNSWMSIGDPSGKRNSSAQTLDNANTFHEVEADEMHGEAAPLQHYDDNDDAREDMEGRDPKYVKGGEHADNSVEHPTTLLAELQLRKQEQKQRNRTAATAFPNGMHSTLLQLDAVAQVQKQTRRQKRTHLAWEDPDAHQPGAENEDDEDVPLGILFPKRSAEPVDNSRRWDDDKPLGLIVRRDIEDNEPLSHRRARLRGENPLAVPDKRTSTYTLDPLSFEDETANPRPNDEEENETLGQRIRRLKATQIPVQTRPVSGDFASEMMSQLGAPSPSTQQAQAQASNEGPQPHRTTKKTPDLEEETLGQRRKRLQAEAIKTRQASYETNGAPARPPMHQRRSMADILQAHPAAGAGVTAIRTLSNEIKFAPAPKTRNTAWAINQTQQAAMGHLPMAGGFDAAANGVYPNGWVNGNGTAQFPHPIIMQQQPAVNADLRQRDMIDRWRQSVMN